MKSKILRPTHKIKQYKHTGLVAGCDEAGRGCLAGPVFAAAVILPPKFKNKILNDSKVLTHKQRSSLRIIIESEALFYGVAKVSEKEIDKINILNASIKAMHKSLDKLNAGIDLILVDGNRFKAYKSIDYRCVIKGDSKYLSIAAASILAKEYRDEYMVKLSKKHPEYTWQNNKGYPTKAHREAIREFGDTKYHRKSFRLLPFDEQLDLFKKD